MEYELLMVLNFLVMLAVLEEVVGILVLSELAVQELLVRVIVVGIIQPQVHIQLVAVVVLVLLVELGLVLRMVLAVQV